ncbi:MAG: ATP-binding protein [Candidatus Methylomirabilia bacterium]
MAERSVQDRYVELLRVYVAEKKEEQLAAAAELGRELVSRDIPLEEVAEIHDEACRRLGVEPADATVLDSFHGLSAPLLEMLMAYSLAFRQRTAELRQSEEHYFRSLIENALDIITILEADGTIRYESPSTRRVLGYHPEELIGRNTFEFIHPEDAPNVSNVLARCSESSGQIECLDFRFRHKDGSWRSFEGIANNLLAHPGMAGLVINSRDITERKRVQEELQRQREALVQREKLAAMGQLLAGVAHELNNPLSVVKGQAALLRGEVGNGRAAHRVDRIAQAAERCARIVKTFLALVREYPPERRQVELNQVVREAVELLAYQLRVDNVDVTLDLAEDLPDLWADPHQLHQVVVNLVSNAHQAMRQAIPPRQLALTTRSNGARGRVHLEVADTGPGISPEIQGRIFDPFFTTKAPGEGTGLGLSLCQGIVEAHGGSITVESQPGHGALFRIQLPVEAPPVAEPDVRAAKAPPPPGGRAILVVDDEPDVAEVLAELLTGDGHQVDIAASGVIALDKLRKRSYDLILSDFLMPELDGAGLHRELQRCWPELLPRFILLTGATQNPEIRAFLEKTGVPTVRKPFELEEVRRAMQETPGEGSGQPVELTSPAGQSTGARGADQGKPGDV